MHIRGSNHHPLIRPSQCMQLLTALAYGTQGKPGITDLQPGVACPVGLTFGLTVPSVGLHSHDAAMLERAKKKAKTIANNLRVKLLLVFIVDSPFLFWVVVCF